MKARYEDILDTITEHIRNDHSTHASEYNAFPSDCTTGDYDRGRACECVAKPSWFDVNGTPRFAAHHPKLAPNIYAHEVVLLRIHCQSCEAPFDVQMDWGSMDDVRAYNRYHQAVARGIDMGRSCDDFMAACRLSGQVRDKIIHYGDPPRHDDTDGGRCAGETINCDDIRVLEFWTHTIAHEWARVPELEVSLESETATEGESC